MKRTDKESWLAEGLEILGSDSPAHPTIEALCERLNRTKGSFYHHFQDMDQYTEALMRYWFESSTQRFIDEAEQITGSGSRIQALADRVAGVGHRCERAIRNWADSNATVARYVKQADESRMAYVTKIAEEDGYPAPQARRIAMIQYALLTGMEQLFPNLPAEEFKQLQDIVIERLKHPGR